MPDFLGILKSIAFTNIIWVMEHRQFSVALYLCGKEINKIV